jgi:hypothetical protein
MEIHLHDTMIVLGWPTLVVAAAILAGFVLSLRWLARRIKPLL